MTNVVQCELNDGKRRAVSWIEKDQAFETARVSLPMLGFFPFLRGEFTITKVYHSPCLPVEWFQKKKEK